jgi:hypothetical protein
VLSSSSAKNLSCRRPHARLLKAGQTMGMTAALLVVLASPAAAQAAGDPLFEAPVVGECHDYDSRSALDDVEESPAVDCSAPHTGIVVAVVEVPGRFNLIDGRTSSQLSNWASRTCAVEMEGATGIGHAQSHLTIYSFAWYVPTRAQVRQGARWVRCDVISWDNGELSQLSDGVPSLKGNLSRSERRCINAKHKYVPCSKSHAWISRGIVRASKGSYSEDRFIVEGRRRCVSTLQRSDRRYRWVPPTLEAWKRGERHIVCYGNGR